MKFDPVFYAAAFCIGFAHLYPRLGLYLRPYIFWPAQALSVVVGLYVLIFGSPLMNNGAMPMSRWVLGFIILMRTSTHHFNYIEARRSHQRKERLNLANNRQEILAALRAGEIDQDEAAARLARLPVDGD